ncbi:MAG: hypothetical protein M0024_06610 [Nitrospiraceae bacterium]|nr:hypothetical protein [Nitrospiraceae bacterium]
MNIIQRLLIGPLDDLFERVFNFMPALLSAMLILLVGLVLAIVTKWIFQRLFRTIGLDGFLSRTGTAELLKRGGVEDSPAVLISKIIGGVIIVIFTGISMRALDLPVVGRLLERLLFYLPNIFVALVIVALGYVLANFFGRTALIASVNTGIRYSGLVGKTVKLTLIFLSATMALEQLGIGSGTIIIAFAIAFGGLVFAISLAFGLGGKDIAREYLRRKFGEEEKEDEINHL